MKSRDEFQYLRSNGTWARVYSPDNPPPLGAKIATYSIRVAGMGSGYYGGTVSILGDWDGQYPSFKTALQYGVVLHLSLSNVSGDSNSGAIGVVSWSYGYDSLAGDFLTVTIQKSGDFGTSTLTLSESTATFTNMRVYP